MYIFLISDHIKSWRTSLMYAANRGHTEVVELLLSNGADKYATDLVSITAYSIYIFYRLTK